MTCASQLFHLQDARIGTNVARVIQEAQSEGVRRFACNGCCEGDWEKVYTLSQSHCAFIAETMKWTIV